MKAAAVSGRIDLPSLGWRAARRAVTAAKSRFLS